MWHNLFQWVVAAIAVRSVTSSIVLCTSSLPQSTTWVTLTSTVTLANASASSNGTYNTSIVPSGPSPCACLTNGNLSIEWARTTAQSSSTLSDQLPALLSLLPANASSLSQWLIDTAIETTPSTGQATSAPTNSSTFNFGTTPTAVSGLSSTGSARHLEPLILLVTSMLVAFLN